MHLRSQTHFPSSTGPLDSLPLLPISWPRSPSFQTQTLTLWLFAFMRSAISVSWAFPEVSYMWLKAHLFLMFTAELGNFCQVFLFHLCQTVSKPPNPAQENRKCDFSLMQFWKVSSLDGKAGEGKDEGISIQNTNNWLQCLSGWETCYIKVCSAR